MAKVDILNYISDSNILRSTYDTDTNELDITDVPQNLNSVITLGQGGNAVLIDKDISANGTYNAADDSADGYKKVVVNVPNPSTGSLSITANGTYDVTNYASADVNISAVSNEDAILDGSLSGAYTNSNVTYLRIAALQKTQITSASFPNVINTGQGAFKECTSLTSVSMAKLATVQAFEFQDCTALTSVDLSLCTSIVAAGFTGCNKLQTVILRSSSVVSLANVNAFQNTPLRGYNSLTGIVYVPSNLISSYQSASNWSSLYNDGYCTFSAIEGSPYE